MSYMCIFSFFAIFLSYIFINKFICGYSFLRHSEYKQEANSLKYLYSYPRTYGSTALNTSHEIINNMIQYFYQNSNNKDLIQMFSNKYNPAIISSSNPFRMHTIHNYVNSSIFYFHKASKSTDNFNISSVWKNIKKGRRKDIIQNKRIINDIYYHNNTKPLIIVCKLDTNPISPSTYDSTIHISAMLEAIKYIFNSTKIANKIQHDFAFVFAACEEFDQLGIKNLMKNIFKNGGYYLFLSGIGVGRPFTLYSQSNKPSSVLKALSKINHLPMASFTSELEDLISLIKSKSFSMSKVFQDESTKHKSKSKLKNIYNSESIRRDDRLSPKILNLYTLEKQGNLKEINRYKYRYHFVNGATQFRKNANFSGAELSFIGNPLLHSTSSDLDTDEHNLMNTQLVTHCIVQFLTHFNSMDDDTSKEKDSVVFGIRPFVLLLQRRTLNWMSFILVSIFAFYLVFYITCRTKYRFILLSKPPNLKEQNEAVTDDGRVTLFSSFCSVLIQELSFICHFSLALLVTFSFYLFFFLLLSVVNTSSLIGSPTCSMFMLLFSVFSVFVLVFEKAGNKSFKKFDWHFLQVLYVTVLLITFRNFDFEILVVITAFLFVILQLCPVHKSGMKWLQVVLSVNVLLPLIFTYALLYYPFSLECQDLPVYYADVVPFVFVFLFFVHMSVFILPFFYFVDEREKSDAETETEKAAKTETRVNYISAISQLLFISNEIKLFFSKSEKLTEKEEKSEVKKQDDRKSGTSSNTNNKPLNKSNSDKMAKPESKSNLNRKTASKEKVDYSNKLNALIEKNVSTKTILLFSFSILLYFLIKTSPFSAQVPVRGTFSHYFFEDTGKGEIAFVPKSGRRAASFMWKSLPKTAADVEYVYNYNGRLLTDPQPAFVKTVENSSLPQFFDKWPKISLSSIQHDGPDGAETNENDDENENKKLRPKMVRKILFNLESIGPNVHFIYFVFKCGQNSRSSQCVDSRIRLVDPVDLTTISYYSSLKRKKQKEEKFFDPYFSDSGETVFRIGTFLGSPVRKRIPNIEINITKNTPIRLTIAYQSFIETKEMKDFKSKFIKFAINEINEYEITQSVFIHTEMI